MTVLEQYARKPYTVELRASGFHVVDAGGFTVAHFNAQHKALLDAAARNA